MQSGTRKHRRHLERLHAEALRDADFVRSLMALTKDDQAWLIDSGWVEPRHASFLRINGLTVDDLPLAPERFR